MSAAIKRETVYQQMIREALAHRGLIARYDPRHIEAWMRDWHGTLDGLSKSQFADAITLAAECVDHGGVQMSERLAQCEGL